MPVLQYAANIKQLIFMFLFIFKTVPQMPILRTRKLRRLGFKRHGWQVAELGFHPVSVQPSTQDRDNLERPVSYPVRFIWGSFLCQRHNVPTMSLLKTAISGTETSIFQGGRLTPS